MFIAGFEIRFPHRINRRPSIEKMYHCLVKLLTVMYYMRQVGMQLTLRKVGNMVTALRQVHYSQYGYEGP